MISITTYVILCIYIVSSCCKEVINISIDEDDNKSKYNIEENIKYPISSSSSGSSENYILSDSSRHRNPIIDSNSNERNKANKVDPRFYDKTKSIGVEVEHDNIFHDNIDTTPHDASLGDSLYHDDMGTILNKDISLKKTLTTPPDGNIIYPEKNQKPDDNLYHGKVRTAQYENKYYNHGKMSHRDKLRNKKMTTSVNDDEKIRRALCEEDLYRTKNIPTATHEGNVYHGRMQTTSPTNGNVHLGYMQSSPSDDDIYHDKMVQEKDNLKEDNFYHGKIENGQLDDYFYSGRMRTALRKDNFYHGQMQKKEPQEDNCSRMKLPTVNDNNHYFRNMESTNENQKELDFIAPTNSTIEVSDYKYQDNRNTEESDEERDSLVDYPYSVSIQRKGAHYASGALVGERWVLSTAAEFYNVREAIKLFRSRLGSADCKKGGILIPLHTITIHPGFTPGRPSLDISVLRLAEPVTFSSKIKPIGLSRVAGKITSAKFLTTYWPRIVVKKGVIPSSAKERTKFSSMRVTTQALVPSDHCSKMMAAVNVTLEKSCLCLKPVQAHHSVCMPDVGAPVVAVDGLWGITSGWVSPVCPFELLPTLFTRVSSPDLRIWINAQMVL